MRWYLTSGGSGQPSWGSLTSGSFLHASEDGGGGKSSGGGDGGGDERGGGGGRGGRDHGGANVMANHEPLCGSKHCTLCFPSIVSLISPAAVVSSVVQIRSSLRVPCWQELSRSGEQR